MSKLKVLILTNLYPSNADPNYAPFNRNQFAALGRIADVEVLNVVPWRFGHFYGGAPSSAGVVREETIDGIHVTHPRFPSIPGVPGLNATLIAGSILKDVAKRHRRKRFDVLLAAYAYPDGCAGVMLGRALKLPVVVKCHGSDLNRVTIDRPARYQLEKLLPRADNVVVVSRRLGDKARELGVAADRIHVV
jgi:teichuronic acid biosynthesis glycosyltransferase TuaC